MASEIFYTTDPSQFGKLEGLYVSERKPQGFIKGADLSGLGIAGLTLRGPERPIRITSPARFLEVFGGRDHYAGGPLANEVWAAIVNKPMSAFTVRRVVAADAVAASLTLQDAADGTGTAVARVDASFRGLDGNSIAIEVEAASSGLATQWNLRVTDKGKEYLFEDLDTSAGFDNLVAMVGNDEAISITVTKLADGRPVAFADITEADFVANKNADDSMNLGKTLTTIVSVAGSDGTPTAVDYNDAVTELAYYDGLAIVMLAGASVDPSSLNATLQTIAPTVPDRVFLAWSGVHGQSTTAAKASIEGDITSRTDRIFWSYNSAYTLDPETGAEMLRGPHEWLATVLQNNDVDIHPGSRQASTALAGIRRLENESLTRADLILLKNAGICALEKVDGAFTFRSGVTTSLTTGREQITRRRMADFLQISAAKKLAESVKAKSTVEERARIAALLIGFSRSLQRQGRVVEAFSVEQEEVNTVGDRAQGTEKVLWSVKTLNHILALVLETDIGTNVIIEK